MRVHASVCVVGGGRRSGVQSDGGGGGTEAMATAAHLHGPQYMLHDVSHNACRAMRLEDIDYLAVGA